jgi:hypothetical protein
VFPQCLQVSPPSSPALVAVERRMTAWCCPCIWGRTVSDWGVGGLQEQPGGSWAAGLGHIACTQRNTTHSCSQWLAAELALTNLQRPRPALARHVFMFSEAGISSWPRPAQADRPLCSSPACMCFTTFTSNPDLDHPCRPHLPAGAGCQELDRGGKSSAAVRGSLPLPRLMDPCLTVTYNESAPK